MSKQRNRQALAFEALMQKRHMNKTMLKYCLGLDAMDNSYKANEIYKDSMRVIKDEFCRPQGIPLCFVWDQFPQTSVWTIAPDRRIELLDELRTMERHVGEGTRKEALRGTPDGRFISGIALDSYESIRRRLMQMIEATAPGSESKEIAALVAQKKL